MAERVVDQRRVELAQAALISAAEAQRLADLLVLVADPVRCRILIALGGAGELCVSDVALTLGCSVDAASYGLRLLRTARLVVPRRDGRVVNYRLADGFPQPLVEHCLRQLLTVSTAAVAVGGTG